MGLKSCLDCCPVRRDQLRKSGTLGCRAKVIGGLVESWAAIEAEEPKSHLSGSFYSG
jgi:hypothetical protein